jgi:hypothetical protein
VPRIAFTFQDGNEVHFEAGICRRLSIELNSIGETEAACVFDTILKQSQGSDGNRTKVVTEFLGLRCRSGHASQPFELVYGPVLARRPRAALTLRRGLYRSSSRAAGPHNQQSSYLFCTSSFHCTLFKNGD